MMNGFNGKPGTPGPAVRRVLAAALLVSLTVPAAARAQMVLTLGDALALAMEKSPRIKHSKLNLERSEASLTAANARLKSKFSLAVTPIEYTNYTRFNDLFSAWYTQESTSSYGTFRIDQPIQWTDGTLSLINTFSWKDSYSEYNDENSETFSNNLYINFLQPIFTYNRTRMNLRSLELDLEKNKLSYAIEKLSIEKTVLEGFYEVYETKKRLEIAMDEYENIKKSHEISKNKVDAGIASLDELYQSELGLANAHSSVANYQVSLENAYDRFKQLLGIDMSEEIGIEADISYRECPVDLQVAISHGLKHRAELRQRQIDIINAEDALVRAGANNEFRGDINISYGTTGTDEAIANLYDSPDKNQQVSVSFEVPLWDWGEKKADIRASRASLESSRLSLAEEENSILISIRQAYRSLENQVIQIDIAKQNVRLSELTYSINLEKYRNGDLSSFDLNQYQNQISSTRLSEVSALIRYKQYLLDMKIQSLWDFENNRPVVE